MKIPQQVLALLGVLARMGCPVVEVTRDGKSVWVEARTCQGKGKAKKLIGYSRNGSLDEAVRDLTTQVEKS